MNKLINLVCLLLFISCNSTKEQNTKKVHTISTPIAKTKHETFAYQEGDTTYIMQKYFLVLLKKGENRNHSKEETAEIQKKHLAHIAWLDKTGKISLAGPSENHKTISGFLLFNTETLEEADSLANLDPAVKAGRLAVETLPWWAAKGSRLK
ncbi:MAG: hypothetical protein KDC50_03835 [Flavobacterium sp.]|uniref:YciI family protein n=1 Tax=Flavobacterium sp. TaxID=239 RepID=UPI001D2F2EA8|nr:hypothetical protein [Flavobacterium sp.]